MSNKCEWKDGKFIGCCTYNMMYKITDDGHSFNPTLESYHEFNFCPYCGESIRKPEPTVTIKKSGETWVAQYDGADYLYNGISQEEPIFWCIDRDSKEISVKWKSISEIKITDEIAKLRPMVIDSVNYAGLELLIAVKGASIWTEVTCADMLSNYRLATVGDL